MIRSAFHHFSREQSSAIKDQLLKDGKDASVGSLAQATSAKWKSLSEHERSHYEDMALEDKERYQEECARRDEEVLQAQEERRKANAVGAVTENRMRNSTMANTDASTVKVESKRKRAVSDKEREQAEAKRQAKKAEQDLIKQQFDSLDQDKAHQAEARLKYLLSQSDVFAHFGSMKQYSDKQKANSGEDMDEDEREMVEEIGEGDEEGTTNMRQATVLTKQPSIITGGQLRAYQLEGLNWMIRLQEYGINGILADEMGLGKTLQSISIVAYMKEFRQVDGPHLVMVPKSTLSNWCNEFKRFCPSLRVLRFHGSKEERAECVEQHLRAQYITQRTWDVVITTYEVVNLEKSALTKIAWKYLIIDEAHRLKNEDSQFSQTVRMLSTQHRLLLTGTPLQNNLHELWALLNFLLPDVFASSEQFDEWFNLDVDDVQLKERMIGQLHKLLRPFMLRRLKADVEKSLPPKTETILFTGLSVMQKNLYRQVLLRDIDTINNNSNSQQSRTAVLNIVMQLRKCCNHPYLFPGLEDRTENPFGDHLFLNCGKMVLLDKLLHKLFARGHRVLIFSQMTRMLDILEDYLLSKSFKYCRIDGNTTYEEREDRIYDFNREGSDRFVFILSTRAGGLGINLQTADTVILYDSDWNPQADLQAQDRAHRIGQKNPVQVFRLVTDDTVEVKVVERAQQKLKLDAMVVQQGRLMDKDKKMSKQELLETLKFGADKIFRSKDSSITDDDIDTILEEGRRRTVELEKLQAAEKGDMYDFRLDGGMGNTQVFEGKDYSNQAALKAKENDPFANLLLFDTGKRERKAVTSYLASVDGSAGHKNDDENGNGGEKKPKLPKHLRLGKLEDWQFFQRGRLQELQAEEIRLFDILVEKGENPSMGSISKLIVLPPELHEEKLRLQSEGFGDWTRVHYNNFLRASAKHGRNEHDKIAKEMNKPLEEIKRYCDVFWTRGEQEFQPQEWDRVIKQIEKGEKKVEEISRLTAATAKLIALFDDPWEELTFRNVGNVNRIFTAVEDRYLLCLTHLHGFGNWEQVRNSIRRCERFRFDFYLQSCSAETIGKRCETLMKSAERELLELERKRQAQGDLNNAAAGGNNVKSSASDITRLKIKEISKQIEDDTKKLALVRAQVKKLKSSAISDPTSKKKAAAAAPAFAIEEMAVAGNPEDEGKDFAAASRKSSGKEGSTGSTRGGIPTPLPEDLYPQLCRLVVDSGADGMSKVIERFYLLHPSYPKRQIEIAIDKLMHKDKRSQDTLKVWHMRKEFEHLLAGAPAGGSQTLASPPPQPVKTENVEKTTSKKRPRNSISNSDAATEDPQTVNSPHNANGETPGKIPKEPRKFKRAFGFFVKEKRSDAEAMLGGEAENSEKLKELLTRMWEDADAAQKQIYEKKEQEDIERYNREKSEYEGWVKTGGGGSSAKRAKIEK
jgi:SWI/SNF-related matrix-associated actin-dependent regulator of chromatin subfamily A member 5